jgi:hypothetical protein
MNKLREYITESSKNINNNSSLSVKLNNTEVVVLEELPDHVNLNRVLRTVSGLLPDKYFYGLDAIYITQHPDFEKRQVNAFYIEGALYISPDQDNNEDLTNDIVHEVGHHLEAAMPEEIYADHVLADEFILKRQILKRKLIEAGINPGEYDYTNLKFEEEFDFFLLKDVGYDKLKYITSGLFLNSYSATSLREYFANGFEEYYLGSKEELNTICPTLYKKLDELHNIAD